MKKIVALFSICSLFILECHSQEISFSFPRDFAVYKGARNSIIVVVEGTKCENVYLKTNNGKLLKTKCSYDYFPDSVGSSKIEVFTRQNKKLKRIGVRWIGVKDIPPPVAIIGGLTDGEIKKGFLNAQQGVGAYADPKLGLDLGYFVESFMVVIIRDGKIIFSNQVEGNTFSKEIHDAFKSLNNNDVILVANIKCKGPDNMELSSKTLEFVIVE